MPLRSCSTESLVDPARKGNKHECHRRGCYELNYCSTRSSSGSYRIDLEDNHGRTTSLATKEQ
eukprot:9023525-Prorocentrum_lima.AAC.1